VSERNFTVDDLQIIEEIEKGLIPCFCKTFGKKSFSYVEVLALIAISKCKRDFSLDLKDVEELCLGIKDHLKDIKQTDFMFVLLDKDGNYFITIHAEQAQIFFDSRWKMLCQIRLNDISSIMKLKYRKSFNFKFDREEEDIPFDIITEEEVLT